jgi:hypothetical protein
VLMPVFAFVLGKLVTHALEARHSIGAIVGIATLIGVALLPQLRSRRDFSFYMTGLLVGIVAVNTQRIRASALESKDILATLTLSPRMLSAIDAGGDRNIYFQDLGV